MIEPVPTDDTTSTTPEGGAADTGSPPAAGDSGAPAAGVAARPDWLPESFWDAEANTPKADDLTALIARAAELEAADEARKAGVPASAD